VTIMPMERGRGDRATRLEDDDWALALDQRLVAAVRDAPRPMAVGLDLDGTLAPLVDHPDLAMLADGALEVLARLVDADVPVAVVSGRSLADLRRFQLPAGVQLVGSHGLEDGSPHGLTPEERRTLAIVVRLAEHAAERAEGVWVEKKPAGIAFHRRMADPDDGVAATAWLAERVGRLDGVWFRPGHDVLELAVTPASKVHAVARLRATAGSVMFVGDDLTDEDVFVALALPDIGVKVGPGASAAPFQVRNPHEVVTLLNLVASVV
jgi:trehalose 6-phosphate synthase/phosphatase